MIESIQLGPVWIPITRAPFKWSILGLVKDSTVITRSDKLLTEKTKVAREFT